VRSFHVVTSIFNRPCAKTTGQPNSTGKNVLPRPYACNVLNLYNLTTTGKDWFQRSLEKVADLLRGLQFFDVVLQRIGHQAEHCVNIFMRMTYLQELGGRSRKCTNTHQGQQKAHKMAIFGFPARVVSLADEVCRPFFVLQLEPLEGSLKSSHRHLHHPFRSNRLIFIGHPQKQANAMHDGCSNLQAWPFDMFSHALG
jgi:hypothetical protein